MPDNRDIQECRNALSRRKTPDEAARRRKPIETDEDRLILGFGRPFSVDARQKIPPSKSFRRLPFKTQVLTDVINTHIRTRFSHTSEVENISSAIARILGLNEDLCSAGSLAHDIGHAPFGHLGETFISEITGKNFRHEVFGVVVAQHIDRRGEGTNLTHQTCEIVLNHSRGSKKLKRVERIPEEGNVVMMADKIAFIFSDAKDIFERMRILDYDRFPRIKKLLDMCGNNQRERFNFCIKDLCFESAEKGRISFEECEAAQIFAELKENMYKVYGLVNLQNANEILGRVYSFLSKSDLVDGVDPAIILALMTDIDVISLYRRDCINATDFYKCSVAEIIEPLKGKKIDFLDPDLNW